MKTVLTELVAAVRDTLTITFVEPVRQGRPRPSSWPRGLPAIGAAALIVYVMLGLATVFAVDLRQEGELVLAQSSQTSLPQAAVGLLFCGVILSLALAHTAALHTSWWLRLALFLLSAVVWLQFVIYTTLNAPWLVLVSLGCYLGLVAFTVVRSRHDFAWWEFVVVTVLLSASLLPPLQVGGQLGETRSLVIEGTLTTLAALTIPALLVAGSAAAQIVVTGAAAAAARPLPKVLFGVLTGIAVAWLLASAVWGILDGAEELNPAAFASGGVTLAGIAAVLAVWLRRGRHPVPDPPAAYPEAWGPWLYPLATAIAGLLLLALPLQLFQILMRTAGATSLADGFTTVWNLIFDNNPGSLWRAGIGVVVLVIAWRISGRGRTTEAAVLGALAVSVAVDALGLLPGLGFLHERTTEAMGLLAAAIALVAGVVLAVRHRLDRARAGAIVTVVLLAVLYPHRNLLADPAGTALVFSAQLVVLFGLTWRLLTDADYLQRGSRHFPQPTRVLLFMANSLFAATSLAFVALARAMGTGTDSTSIWSDAGDWTLGEALFTIGLVAAVWLAVRPSPASAEQQHQGDHDDAHGHTH
ncbi:MAG: hypothetical protein VB080_15795 [Propionicimonas sp.]|uniref:hypothetical protein n=1 Tax=Propionicimonas sp. TaxID=1955623 RepID=UPI002B1F763E|nr:hypothetical protein [Propionicimonas sp.]MEA4945884.1 hypothetical protein [Propionicimonas sp.]MEA5052089.1 hypothetical protein [Propionicimonas sp.]